MKTLPKTAHMDSPKPDQIKPDLSQQPKPGDNGPSREDLLFFAGQIRLADEKCTETRDARKKLRQAAVLRGIQLNMLDWVMKVAEEDDDTILDNLRTFKSYAQAFDLPIGSQLDLFGTPGSGSAQANGGVSEKAFRSGYQRGVAGLGPDDQAYPPMTVEGQEHMRGWSDGQKVNHEKLLKLNAEAKAADEAKAAKKAAKSAGAEGTTH